jgi:hypothetical protein
MALTVLVHTNPVRQANPSIEIIGVPSNLNNYLLDSGAMQHMTHVLQIYKMW